MNCTNLKEYIPVRIGNPVTCIVPVEIDGEPANLSGIEKNRLEIWLKESTRDFAAIRIRTEDITIDGDRIIFTIQPEQQRAPGAYRLFIRYTPANSGVLGKFTHDVRAIQFVRHSEDVTDSDFRVDIETQVIQIRLLFMAGGGGGYVSSVQQFDTHLNFPNIGSDNVMYIDKAANKTYRWDSGLLKYFVIGSDYNDIAVIDGGSATKTI